MEMPEQPAHSAPPITCSAVGATVLEAFARVSAAQVELWETVAALDRNGGWAIDGFRSLPAWLSVRLGIGMGHATTLLTTARAAAQHPAVTEAVRYGALSEHKARLLLEVCTDERVAFVERDLELLVDRACELRLVDVRTLVRHWTARVDTEIAEQSGVEAPDPDEAAHELRRFDLGAPCLGTTVFDGVLDPEGDLVVRTAFDVWARIEQPDVAMRLDDPRSAAQRRHDALVGICRFFLATADKPVIGGDRPTVNVTIDLDVLQRRAGMAADDRGGLLTAETVRRMCCDGNVNRIVLSGASVPLDAGRTVRTPPPALRRAVVARDRHCRFPGCTVAARFCDAHHIVHWADGGVTSSGNLVLLCGFHHRTVHNGRWRIAGNADGALTVTRPDGTFQQAPPPGPLTFA